MKVSASQREENRKKIIQSAVELVMHEGLEQLTLRKVATQAGLGETTAYKYVSTKHDIIDQFFELTFEQVKFDLNQIKAIQDFSLQEQLQLLFDTQLKIFKTYRGFLQQVFKGWNHQEKPPKPNGALFKLIVKDLIEAAHNSGEIPAIPLIDFVVETLWDFNLMALKYWAFDDSPKYIYTTQFVDQGLTCAYSILSSDILNSFANIGQGFVRHLFSRHSWVNK